MAADISSEAEPPQQVKFNCFGRDLIGDGHLRASGWQRFDWDRPLRPIAPDQPAPSAMPAVTVRTEAQT